MKMKMHYFVIVFLLIFINSAFSQITFQRTFGGAQDDVFYSVQQTFDGGYILVGYTKSFGAGGTDVYLVKTDSNGDTLWTKTFGGPDSDYGYYVQQTLDSGYIITGSTSSFGGIEIVWLIKTDSIGNSLWTKTYQAIGHFAQSGGIGISVKQTFDGGFIINCAAKVNSYEILLIKTDALGDTTWTKQYGMHIDGGLIGNSIQQTADSGYIITGTRDPYDAFLLKTDMNGNLMWKRTYGSSNYDRGFSVEQTLDGGFVVTGYQDNIGGGVYVIKTDSSGDTLWTKAFILSSGNGGNGAYCIRVTSDAGYIITGVTQGYGGVYSDVYLIKTDSIGDTLWTKSYGGSNFEYGYSVQQTIDGGYILAGYSFGLGAGNNDGYLIKTDANGNSGCYEHGTNTIIRIPTAFVTIPVDTDSLGITFTFVNSNIPLVGSGGIINTCATLGLFEIQEENGISIYPNPANNYFTIKINEELKNSNIEIYNVLNEIIYSEKLYQIQEILSCSAFIPGIYFISVRKKNIVATKKLIIN